MVYPTSATGIGGGSGDTDAVAFYWPRARARPECNKRTQGRGAAEARVRWPHPVFVSAFAVLVGRGGWLRLVASRCHPDHMPPKCGQGATVQHLGLRLLGRGGDAKRERDDEAKIKCPPTQPTNQPIDQLTPPTLKT